MELQTLTWEEDESVTLARDAGAPSALEELDWDDDEATVRTQAPDGMVTERTQAPDGVVTERTQAPDGVATERTQAPEEMRLPPPRLPPLAQLSCPSPAAERAAPAQSSNVLPKRSRTLSSAVTVTPIIAVNSDAPPVEPASDRAVDPGRRAARAASGSRRDWDPRATLVGGLPPALSDATDGLVDDDALPPTLPSEPPRSSDAHKSIALATGPDERPEGYDTDPSIEITAAEDAGPDLLPHSEEVDLSDLGMDPRDTARALPLLTEPDRAEDAFTPVPQALRSAELRGSYPPVSISEPPPTPRAPRAGLAAVLSVALACLALMAYVAYPRSGSLQVQLRTASGGPASKAEIFVDGQRRCETDPCIVHDLKPGTKTVKVIVPGGEPPKTAHVDVVAGERRVVWIDVPVRQGVQVASPHADVRLQIDGVDRGLLPAEITDLSAGSHTLRFEAPGFVTLERAVQVEAGTLVDLGEVELMPDEPAATVPEPEPDRAQPAPPRATATASAPVAAAKSSTEVESTPPPAAAAAEEADADGDLYE